jgi:hypothetical protein
MRVRPLDRIPYPIDGLNLTDYGSIWPIIPDEGAVRGVCDSRLDAVYC